MKDSGTGDTVVMHSPMRGVVSTIDGAVGQTVGTTTGTTTVTGSGAQSSDSSSSTPPRPAAASSRSSRCTPCRFGAYFSEADIVNVRRGRAATLTFDVLPGRTVRATVSEIDPTSTVSNNVVEYGVTVSLRNQPASLRPGQTATIQIVTARATNALYVPSAAVQTAGGQSTVTVLRNGKQVTVAVQLGVQGDQTTQILSGLTQGERVVIPTATTGPEGSPAGASRGSAGFGGGFGGGGGGAGRAEAAEDERRARDQRRTGRPAVHLTDVTKVFGWGEAEVRALDGVSLTVGAGDYVAIMGASGSGKSTLMHIIGCLDSPTSGRYLLDGIDVGGLGDADLALVRNRKVGFVFQSFNLLPRTTALANVELPLAYAGVRKRERRDRAEGALHAVGLVDRGDHRPSELSGGQQQRVAVARALVTNPALLLADEPTGNLDSRSTADLLGVVDELNDTGRTVILVTHEDSVAGHAKRVIRLVDGRIVEDRRVAGVGDRPPLLRDPGGTA